MQNYTTYNLPLCVQKFCEYVVKISLVCDTYVYIRSINHIYIYILIYAISLTEAWTMTKKEQAVLIFERKIFRRIYGAKCENGEWKSRTNRELEEMSKGENTVKWIKGQRISWLGHLERMEEDRMPKEIFTQELEGTRRR